MWGVAFTACVVFSFSLRNGNCAGIKKSLLPTFNAPTTFNDRQIHPITAQPVTYLKALVPIQLP